MYIPKIKDDLIRKLYIIAQRRGKPMTKIVDELLRPRVVRIYNQVSHNHLPQRNKKSKEVNVFNNN